MRKLTLTALAIAGLTQATGCIIQDGGSAVMEVSWDLVDRGAPASCSFEGATTVRVTATDSGGHTSVFDFPCTEPFGQTDPLDLDTYTVQVEIRDGSGTIGGPATYTVDLAENGITYDVRPVHFDFSRYNVTYSVDFGALGGLNCTNPGAGCPASTECNGLVDQAIYLYRNSDSQCSSYVIRSPVTTDPDGDGCGTLMLCLETNDNQTALNLPPGDYELVAEGYMGAVQATPYLCYQPTGSGALFSIPTGSTTDPAPLPEINVPYNPPAGDTLCQMAKR